MTTAADRRFRQSVVMYRKWLNHEKDWLQIRRTSPKATPRKANGGKANGESATDAATAVEAPTATVARAGMIAYPLPIRPGVKGSLILPEDLSRREAERVAQFVAALAFHEHLAIASGNDYAEIVED